MPQVVFQRQPQSTKIKKKINSWLLSTVLLPSATHYFLSTKPILIYLILTTTLESGFYHYPVCGCESWGHAPWHLLSPQAHFNHSSSEHLTKAGMIKKLKNIHQWKAEALTVIWEASTGLFIYFLVFISTALTVQTQISLLSQSRLILSSKPCYKV